MKYATTKNYRNRMKQFLVLALMVLGGNMAWGQWTPSSAGTYRLRSTSGNSDNTFDVYDADGNPTEYTDQTSIGQFSITDGTYKIIFENTRTIIMTGQIAIGAAVGTPAHLIMELGTLPEDEGEVAHTADNPTLRITDIPRPGNGELQGIDDGDNQAMAFYIPKQNNADNTQHTITIKGIAPTGTENISNFEYNFSNNFVIDGSGPTLTLVDSASWTPKVLATGGEVVGNGMFRLHQGSLTLENVTVQNYSSSYSYANMIHVFPRMGDAAVKVELNHCYFHQIGAQGFAGSPVIRLQGDNANTHNNNRSVVIQNCKFEDIFASYQLAVGDTTAINDANATIRSIGNNKTTLAIYHTHITKNYGCPVRWHGACTDSKLKVYNCLIENNFTCLDNNSRGGGGLLLKGPAEIKSCTIRNNRTQGDGGGIYLSTYTDFPSGIGNLVPDHSVLDLDSATTITNNVAYRNGGGVAIDGIRMRNTLLASNLQHPNGLNGPDGYIWFAPDGKPFTLRFQLNGGIITDNEAKGVDMANAYFPPANPDAVGLGGGISIMRNTETTYFKIECILDKGLISGNIASSDSVPGKGGGVAIYSPNTYSNPSGAPNQVQPQDIEVVIGTSDDLEHTMVIDTNMAANGGGVYVEGYPLTYHGRTSQVYTTLLASAYVNNNNRATNNGGGVFMKTGLLTMNNCTIDNNTAGNDGGGIYVEEGTITTAIRTAQEQSEAPSSSSTLPAPYLDVEYIAAACNGSNYIDTRIMANAQQTIEVRGERGSIGMTQLLYAYVTNNNRLGVRFYSGGIQYSWRQGGNGTNVGTNNTTTSYANMGVTNPEVKIVMNRSRIFLQDATGNYYTNSVAGPNNSTNIANWQIFKGQNTSSDIAKFYEARIYTGGTISATTGEVTGGTLLAHLLPCYNTENGKIGVFDTIKYWNNGEYGIAADECFIQGNGTITFKEKDSSSGGGSGTVPVSGSTITNNTAAYNGGGIYLNTGNIFLTSTKINSNHATNSSGGGVYNHLGNIYVNYWDAADPTQGTNLTVRGETTPSEFNNNTAGRNGGGLNTHRGRIYMRGQTTSKEITISGNTAGNGGNKGSGGGIFCMGDGSDPTAEQIRLFNVNMIGNKAHGKGTTTTTTTITTIDITPNPADPEHPTIDTITTTTTDTVTNGSGGGIYLQFGGINITKVKMQGNYAKQNGGGVNNHNGVINVRGCTIGGDTYYNDGEALEGNKADSCGGGVYTQNGNINITNHKDASLGDHISKFSYNIAGDNGGGINTHAGKVVATGEYTDNFSKDIFIDHNKATNGSGGGIFCMGTGAGTLANPDLLLTYVSLVGNKAEEGTGDTVNGVIRGSGGGMYLQKGAIRVQDADMEGNYANHNGGAINNHEGDILILGSMIGGDTYYSNGARGQGNKAINHGGGIYTNLGNIDIQDYIEHLQGNVRHLESKVTYNEAGENGGGINTHSGIITVNYDKTTGMERETDHVIEIAYNKAKKGGGIYANTGTIITANAKIENNWATENGGGVNNHAGDITFYGGTLSNNTAESGKGGGAFTFVGDVKILPFPVDWTGSATQPTLNDGMKIYNNIAKLNGGGINNHTGRIDMRHARMKNNTSTLGNGGGIFCEGPHSDATGFTIRLLCSEVVQNKTRGQDGTEAEPTGRGGGIYLKYGSIYAHSSDILLNSANINGGGVDNHEGTMLLYGCTLDGNTAVTGRGGGIYTHSGDITTGPSIDRNDNTKSRATLIQYNTAKINGGGINNHQGNIFLNGDHILNNTAEEGHGGGIYINDGIIDMYGGKIANNEAKLGNGGGVYSGGGEFNIQKRQGKPIVEIVDVEVKGANTATVHYHLIDKGKGASVTEHGIFWDIHEIDVDTVNYETFNLNYAYKINIGHIPGEDGCYRLNITIPDSLVPAGKTFYTKAYAVNNATPTALSNTSSVAAFTTFSNKPTVLTGGVSNITSNSAEANGKVLYAGTGEGTAITAQGIQVWKKYKKVEGQYVENTPTADDLRPASDLSEFFTVSLEELQNDTVYCMRAYATNVESPSYPNSYSFGETEEFWTLKDTPTMDGALTITGYELENGKYKYTFKYTKATGDLTAYGFVISTDDDPELHADGDHTVTGEDGTSFFTGTKNGLEGGTTYYVRAYASKIVNPGTVISNYAVSTPIQFITPNANGDPVVRATEISGITRSSATITGLLVHKGSDPILEYGVCFSTTIHHPDHEHCTDIDGTDPAANTLTDSTYFNIPLTSLTPNTTYYLCIYATNGRQEGDPAQTVYVYSNDYNFTTLPIELPKMEVNVKDITNTTATLECKVDTCGAALVTTNDSYGFMLREDDDNTDTTVYASNYDRLTGKFSVEIEDLSADTKYWVKAFCSNATGTPNDGSGPNESREVSFNTLYPMPVVDAVTIHDILYDATAGTSHTIRVYGNATPGENGPAIKKFGYIYSTRNNATIYTLAEDYDEEAVEVGPGNMGSGHITNLTDHVKDNRYYYVRAYASARENPTSDNDYSYGATTRVLTLAHVNRNGDATSTNESAQLPARISSYDEEHHLKKYGVCWAVQPTIPTIGENNYVERDITNESTPLDFSLNTSDSVASLAHGVYYWRAYVKNEDNLSDPTKGIAYTSAGTFIIYDYAVTAEALPAASATITGTGYFNDPNPPITLTVSTGPDYQFEKWTNESDDEISTTNPYEIPAGSLTSSSHFKAYIKSKVSIAAGTGGTVSFDGYDPNTTNVMFSYDTLVTVCAVVNSGYVFTNWTDAAGEIVSEDANYSFNVTEAIRLTANFVPAGGKSATSNVQQPRPRDIYPAPAREPWDWDDDYTLYRHDGLRSAVTSIEGTMTDTVPEVEDEALREVCERLSRNIVEPEDIPHIIENRADSCGGGVFVDYNKDNPSKIRFSGGENEDERGKINNNYAKLAGGGVYISLDATLFMRYYCEVNNNHVDAIVNDGKQRGGGGIYLGGILKVGENPDDAEDIHSLKVDGNWAGTELQYNPSLPDVNNRNNVYLPEDPIPLPESESWNALNGLKPDGVTPLDKPDKQRVITLLSNIAGKYDEIDPSTGQPVINPETNEPQTAYYTRIGISVDHGFRGVIYTPMKAGTPEDHGSEAESHEKWLIDLVPSQGGALESAFFDDANMYYALHVQNVNNPDDLKRQYDYLYGCWTTAVRIDPRNDHDKFPLPDGFPEHFTIDEPDTWHIYTKYGLAWFTSWVNGLNGNVGHPDAKAFIERDMDMREHIWIPIGTTEPYPGYGTEITFRDGGAYVGEFNGQGHLITGLQCRYATGVKKYGLFGTVSKSVTIKKLVKNNQGQITESGELITVDGNGIVKNTFVDDYRYWTFRIGEQETYAYKIGGIAGEVAGGGTVCASEARGLINIPECVPNQSYVGGLVGKVEGTAAVPAQEENPAVPAMPAVVHSSMAMPEIKGMAKYVGGLVGYLGATDSLLNSFSNSKFTGSPYNNSITVGGSTETVYFGGLVGVNNGLVENCYTRLQGNEPQNSSNQSIFGWLAGTNNDSIKFSYAPYSNINNGGVYEKTGNKDPKGHGTYTVTQRYSDKYGFKHRDHQMAKAIEGHTNPYIIANKTNDTLIGGLMHSLNEWVKTSTNGWSATNNTNSKGYAVWTRTMASSINDDYPIPMLDTMNKTEKKTFNSVGSKDGIYMLYEDNVNDMWAATGKNFVALNGTTSSVAAMYLYDVQPITTPATGTTPAVYATVDITGNINVPLYINEDIGITQPVGAELTARAGVTIKNARKGDSDFTNDPNWHLFSSAIKNVPIGIEYRTWTDKQYVDTIVWKNGNRVQHHFHAHEIWIDRTIWDPPVTRWYQSDHQPPTGQDGSYEPDKIGYFPTNTPYGRWRTTSIANSQGVAGFFDLYEYNEYYFHWINYKREGTDTIQDHWHWDVDYGTNLHYRIGYNKAGDDRYFNDVTMPAGKGYLMALSSESMMMADGILNTGDISVKVTNTPIGENLPPNGHGSYNYTVDWRTLNMIGNPYQSYLDFDKFAEDSENKTKLDRLEYAVADDSQGPEVEYRYIYYVKGQSDNPYYSASRYIHPHQGFFVKAASTGNLTFTDNMRVAGKIIINNDNNADSCNVISPYRGNVNYPLVNLLCFDEDGKRDHTTVEVNRPEFGGGHKMEKLHESKGLIYAHLENESFQTLFTPVGINVVPVRFVPNEDGVFTLNWNTRHGQFSYLHLIDNIAGVDVDCLTNDEYKFEGKTTDYKSRFKLVFRCEGGEEPDDPEEPEDPEGEDEDDHFAFFFEDELIVNGEGLLQVFDIQGRCLLETEAIGQQSSHRLPRVAKGVYLLRLTSNKKVKIQKMVI